MYSDHEGMQDTADASGTWLIDAAELSVDAIVCVDDDQSVVFFNEGAAEILGYSSSETLGERRTVTYGDST